MVSKKRQRELRREAKLRDFEETKKQVVSRLVTNTSPKVDVKPQVSHQPKIALEPINPSTPLLPTISTSVYSRFSEKVSWSDAKADRAGKWSWGESRNWDESEWNDVIHPAFRNFQSLTWAEVDNQSSGTGHKHHHSHEISDLIAEAQVRWVELRLEEFSDLIFRFRLGGKRRVWGYVVQAHFFIIWWDRNHSIYPV